MNTLVKILIIGGILTGIYYLTREETTQIPTESPKSEASNTQEVEQEIPPTPSPEGDASIILNEDQGLASNTLKGSISLPQENATWTLSYSGNTFSPQSLTIKKGDTVRFVNNSDEDMMIVSNPHPEHTDLPSLNSEKSLAPGGVYVYTFKNEGTWKYHNHSNPSVTGTVIVK